MQILRLVFIVSIVPFALSACQNSFTDSNAYSGGFFSQPLTAPVQLKSLIASNEASSSVETTSSVPTRHTAFLRAKKPSKAVEKVEEVAVTNAVGPRRKLTSQQRLAEKRDLYKPIIAKHAKANGVPLKLALAVVQVESNYRPSARGRAGEIGLMQLLPRTARYIGYEGEMKHLYHPDTNIRYGMKYLGKAYKLGGGSTCGAILKYNAGHGAKRMNKVSRHYCKRVQQIMRQT
ncbi:MAG: transglycosylase SLT domain-containing protein [Rhizobiaceae bacterium]